MPTLQSSLCDAVATAVERTSHSIVHIGGGRGRRRTGATGILWGAGVVVASDHTIDDVESVSVRLPDGREVPATLAGRDGATDIAVLRTDSGGDLGADTAGTPSIAWSDHRNLRVGHLAIALSRPGRSVRAVLGMIAALGDEWRTPAGGRVDRYIEADVRLRPGFSGGLLVDLDGHAIGLNTAGLIRGTAMALPESTVKRVTEAILATGCVERGFLGVGTYPVRLPAKLAENAGQRAALLVVSIHPGGPAESAGMILGDAILAYDGNAVLHPGDLLSRLGDDRAGKHALLRVVRGGEIQDIGVIIGTRGDAGERGAAQP